MNNEINYVSPFKKFCITIGNLPTAYLESMSYYEGLTYLVNYLSNNVIPALNNNGEVVEELQAQFTILKNYVDNYFENLDVQEEVNAKLDQMALDGTLQELIADYLNTKAIFGFDNVSSMKSSTNLINGSFAKTLGYYTKNDGGSALYKIRELTNEDIIDEMFIIALNDPQLIAELCYANEVNTKQCGLVGDGSENETTKLNAFLSKDINANKVINKGIYLITNTLYVQGQWKQTNNSHFKIIFDKATIKYTGTSNGCSLFFYNLYQNEIIGLSIESDSNINYIDFMSCTNSILRNFDIDGLGIRKDKSLLPDSNYQSQAVELMSFEDGNIKNTITINPTGSYANQINFTRVNINPKNHNYCVDLLGSNSKHNINFNQCDLSLCDVAVFNVNEANTGHGNISCINCYFDSGKPMFSNNTQNGIRFNNISNKFSAGSISQVECTKLEDMTNNLTIGNDIFSGNKLPLIMRNYAKYGDIPSTTLDNSQNRLLGISRTNYDTKEVVTSNSGLNGYAQKITYATDDLLYIDSIPGTAPFKGHYNLAIRMKVISGSCTKIQLGLGGEYMDYAFDKLPIGEEIIITNNKYITRNINDTLRGSMEVIGNNNLIIEVYEAVIIYGNMTLFGLPMVTTA